MALQYFDMFGIRIGLRYKQRESYQTQFGGIISIIIWMIVVVQMFIVGRELFEKQNPDVISSERYVASPEKYSMGIDNFNLAFGVQAGGTYAHFIDESVYNVKAEQIQIKKVLNKTTNQYDQIFENKLINLSPCQDNNFQVESTKTSFEDLAGVHQMYCMDQESIDIHMVGDFSQDDFGYLKLTFTICDQSIDLNCKDLKQVQSALQGSFVALYTNDIIIDPKQNYPFDKVFKDFYWNSSPKIAKEITLNYRNVYVESDNGIFFEDISYDRDIVLSFQNEQVINQFYKIYFLVKKLNTYRNHLENY